MPVPKTLSRSPSLLEQDGVSLFEFERGILQDCMPQLEQYVRRKVSLRYRRFVDTEQIALIAIYEYLARLRVENLVHACDSRSLSSLLRCIAKRRLIDELNHVNRLRSADSTSVTCSRIQTSKRSQIEVDLELADQLERLRLDLSENESFLLNFLCAGYTVGEIARHMNVTRKTVGRWRKRIQESAASSAIFSTLRK